MIQQPITGHLRPADLAALAAIKDHAATIRAIVAQVAAEAGIEGNPTLKGDAAAAYRALAWGICANNGLPVTEIAAEFGVSPDVVRDGIRAAANSGDRVGAALQSVCDEFEVSMADLKGRCTARWITGPRDVAYQRLHDLGLSTTRIGAIMGGRDHTTVMHGLRKGGKP